MPVYDMRCPSCGRTEERLIPKEGVTCACGETMQNRGFYRVNATFIRDMRKDQLEGAIRRPLNSIADLAKAEEANGLVYREANDPAYRQAVEYERNVYEESKRVATEDGPDALRKFQFVTETREHEEGMDASAASAQYDLMLQVSKAAPAAGVLDAA